MIGKIIGTNGISRRGRVVFGFVVAWVAFGFGSSAVAEEEPANLARGEQLFALCTQCHGTAGGGNSEVLAPAIAGMPAWYVERQLKNFKNGIRGLHAQDTGGLRMYPMSLWLRNEADQKAVSAYVQSLPATDPVPELTAEADAAKGAGYYAVCGSCHGQAGEGNEIMAAPPLTGQSDWYLLSSIKKYKSSIRGSAQGDTYGAAMIGMVGTLPDDQAILDVIAHIQSLEQ